MRNLRGLFWLIALLLAASMEPSAHAQDNPNFDVGLAPFGSYHGGNIDQVSLANGSLNVEIPLISYPQRGGKLKMDFVLEYLNRSGTANTWCDEYDDCYTDYTATIPQFNFFDKDEIGIGNAPVDSGCDYDGWYSNYCHYYIADATGANHLIAPTASGTVPWLAVDASGIKASSVSIPGAVPGSIIDSAGTVYYPATGGSPYCVSAYHYLPDGDYGPGPGFIEVVRTDSNGNEITCSSSGIEDSMGRTIPLPTYSDDSGDFGGCPDISSDTISTTFFVLKWNPPGIDGDGQYKMKFCYVYDSSETWDGPDTGTLTHMPLLSAVILPNNTAWYFTYTDDTLDNLQQVTLPIGGTISYGWWGDIDGGTPVPCADGNAWEYNARINTRTLDPSDGVDPTEEWDYGSEYNGTYVRDPAGNDTVHTMGLGSGYYVGCYPYETETKYYSGHYDTGTLLKTVDTTYSYNTVSWIYGAYAHPLMINLVPQSVSTTLNDTSENSETLYTYDAGFAYRQPLYNSYTGALESTAASYTNGSYGRQLTAADYDSTVGLRRTTTKAWLALSNSTYKTDNLLDLLSSVQVKDSGGTQRAYMTYCYDGSYGSCSGSSSLVTTSGLPQHTSSPDGNYRGNLSTVSRWLDKSTTSTSNCGISVSNAPLVSFNVYNDTGTLDHSVDYCGSGPNPTDSCHLTQYTYDSTAGGFVTEIQHPKTGSGCTVAHNEHFTNNFNTGLLTSHEDENSQTTNYTLDTTHGMLRTTRIDFPDGGQTNVCHTDESTCSESGSNVATVITDNMSSGQDRVAAVMVDGLGREIRRNTSNGESPAYDQTDTCRDDAGRVSFKSYPYQSAGLSSTTLCSTAGDSFAYEALNRVTTVTHSDSSTISTSYTGWATSVQDEGNGTQQVQRISQVDGLGRLASVCEVTGTMTLSVGISGSTTASSCGLDISGTGFLTTYSYDVLDNLTSVSQGPLNSRTFTYDSLSHLTSASNPETGAICYGTVSGTCQNNGYDADGNDIKKTDARGTTITYAYNNLNQILGETYTDSTPAVTYNYDETAAFGISLTNTNARMSSESTAGTNSTGSVFSYDQMGRVKDNSQCTPQGNCLGSTPTLFSVEYTYDYVGDILTSTDGASVTFTDTYNTGARLKTIASSLSDSSHPPTLFGNSTTWAHYNAAGSLASVPLGNSGLCELRSYDGRLRLTGISDGTGSTCSTSPVYSLSISSGYAPDSDVVAANDSVNGNWTYGYDPFNRLLGSNQNSGTVIYAYEYDRFGNRWLEHATTGSGAYSSLGFDANNHITTSGYGVDAAGNVTADGSHTYTYDAENRVAQVDSGSTASYVYDASGHRVRKTVSGTSVDFVYDLVGHEIAEFASSGGWNRGEVYAGGLHVVTYNGGTTYFNHADWLGTERARSNVSGTLCESIISLPFGDGLSTSGGCDPSPMHFTGKERDSESGLDNFGARYNSSSMGRFMSPDPRTISLRRMVDPQQWNMYAYVRNNPMVHVDPDGQELHLVIYNSSSIDKQLITRVAIGIASKYQAAGVKNVSYEIRQGKPGTLTQAAAELLPTPHSHLLEIRKDKEGNPTIPNGEGGHNWDFGGHSAVDASAVSEIGPKSDNDLVDGLVNVGTHESGHDVLGHQGGDNDIMNGSGEADPNWLFNPNLQFSPGEATALQNKYNSSDEVELTPPPPPPPPPPPCATDTEHPC